MFKSLLTTTFIAISYSTKWTEEFTQIDLKEFELGSLKYFNEWAKIYSKTYKNIEDESHHYLQWLENVNIIAEHNSKELSYKYRLNQFSDLSTEDFRIYVHGKDGRCFKQSDTVNLISLASKESSSSSSSSSDNDSNSDSDSDKDNKKRRLTYRKPKKTYGNARSESSSDSDSDSTSGNNGGYSGKGKGKPGYRRRIINADPTSVDWRSKGVVTPVKNQGQCGSCWSFSTTGALECDYAIKTGTLNSLSEQQLVDCAGLQYGCMGCNGGEMTGAMRYVSKEGGLCTEKEYPYTAKNGNCKATSCGTKYDKNSGYNSVKSDSSQALEDATAAGCVSIAIEADQTAFQHYSGGVLTGNCGTNLDHGVLVVGYGTESGQDYWLVKNSWGASWGESGYVKICRNCNKNSGAGECGILMQPIVPTF